MDNKAKLGILVFGVIFGYFILKNNGYAGHSVDEQLEKIADEYNKTCPNDFSDYAVTDSSKSLGDKTICYYVTIGVIRDSSNLELLELMVKSQILKNYKSTSSVDVFRKNDVTIKFNFNCIDKEPLFDLVFKADEY